jgi:hypothetical protein
MTQTNTRIFVEIELPAPLDAIADVMSVIGTHWPTAAIDTKHHGGWMLKVGPQHRPDPADPAAPTPDPVAYVDETDPAMDERLAFLIHLYGDRQLKANMTTDEREFVADAAENYSRWLNRPDPTPPEKDPEA